MASEQERLVTTFFHRMRAATKRPMSEGAEKVLDAVRERSAAEVRATIQRAAAERGESLLSLSVALGKNEAYLQQFIRRGTPKRLPEEERRKLAQLLWVDERLLGAREPWSPTPTPETD